MVNPHPKAELGFSPSNLVMSWEKTVPLLFSSLIGILDLRLPCLRRTLRNWVLSLEVFSHCCDSESVLRKVTVTLSMTV